MATSSPFDHLGSDLTITYVASESLAPYKNNPRTHTKKQINQIAKSIKEFGFINPMLVDDTGTIIAGHGRLEAIQQLGIKQVPVIRLNHLTEAQRKAYAIADNKLAELAGWDENLLKIEFESLAILDIDYDLTITGFEMGEIDFLLAHDDETEEPEPAIPPPPINPVSQIGDVWILGRHRLICADATDPVSYDKLMDGKKASLIFTDPPYNVAINGHVCGNGKVKHDEFVMASGEMSETEFTDFLGKVFKQLCAHSTDGSMHYICMDWRHIRELQKAASVYTELKNLCVWNKTNGGMGSLYRSKHELVFVYKNGTKPHINNVELGKNGRYRTNVWDYEGVNCLGAKSDLELHPTVKPVAMIRDAIQDCSKRGDIVLDVFGGSGSTLLAAEACGRVANLMELDPKYVDVIIHRYQDEMFEVAIHEDGLSFAQKREARHGGE